MICSKNENNFISFELLSFFIYSTISDTVLLMILCFSTSKCMRFLLFGELSVKKKIVEVSFVKYSKNVNGINISK